MARAQVQTTLCFVSCHLTAHEGAKVDTTTIVVRQSFNCSTQALVNRMVSTNHMCLAVKLMKVH